MQAMNLKRPAEAFLVGTLSALAIFCAVQARGGENHSIVAQSNASSAGTGRRPIAQRIISAGLPIVIAAPQKPAPVEAATPVPAAPLAAVEPLATPQAVAEPAEAVPAEVKPAEAKPAANPEKMAEAPAVETPPASPSPEPEQESAAAPEASSVVEPPVPDVATDEASQGEMNEEPGLVDVPSAGEDAGEVGGDVVEAADDADDADANASEANEQLVEADESPLPEGQPQSTPAAQAPALVADYPPPLPPPAETVRSTLLKRVRVALAGMPRPIPVLAPKTAPRPAVAPPRHGTAPAADRPAGAPPTAARPAAARPAVEPRKLAAVPAESMPAAVAPPAVADTIESPPAAQLAQGGGLDTSSLVPAPVPALLEFDVRESRSLVTEGEQIVMRIAVKNVGGVPVEGVTATLFFAEGVEPVRSIGHSAELHPGEVRFEAVDRLQPGNTMNLIVTAVGTKAGNVAYRGELECRQLPGRLAREGAVTVGPRKEGL